MSKKMKVGKFSLWAIISAVIVAAGVVIAAVFGFNPEATVSDAKTVSVKLSATSPNSSRVGVVREICEKEFDNAGLNDLYTLDSRISADSEIIYVFSPSVTSEKLEEVKTSIGNAIETERQEGGRLYGYYLYVTSGELTAKAVLPSGYVLRSVLAGVVAVVLIFAYVSVRYKLNMGITAAVSTLVGTALTVSVVAIVRLPVTASLAYAGAFALLYTAILSLVVFNKMRENFRTDGFKDKTAAEAISESIPVKRVLTFALICAVALVLVGAIAVPTIRWFAVAGLIGIVAGTYASLIFLPAMYLPLKKASDKRAAERARYDYKKNGKKEKKAKNGQAPAASPDAKSAPEA